MIINKLRKILSKRDKFLKDKRFRIFGERLRHPSLWYFNKYTVSRAFSIGLFCAWVPVPMQMLLSGSLAIVFRSNFPVSVSLVWLTNPFTMPMLFLFAYNIGAFFLKTEPIIFDFELSFSWLINKMCYIWQPFLLGCFICATVSSIVGNICVRIGWRISIILNWFNRKA